MGGISAAPCVNYKQEFIEKKKKRKTILERYFLYHFWTGKHCVKREGKKDVNLSWNRIGSHFWRPPKNKIKKQLKQK